MKHAFFPDLTAIGQDGTRQRVCATCGGVERAALHAEPAGCEHEGREWRPARPGACCPFCAQAMVNEHDSLAAEVNLAAARPGRDACQFCLGAKGGVPGNENRFGEVIVCDYCTPLVLQAIASETTEMRVCEIAHLILRPGQRYRFSVDETCAGCRAYGGGADLAEYARQIQPIDHEFECRIPAEQRGPVAHLLVCEKLGCPDPSAPHPRRLL